MNTVVVLCTEQQYIEFMAKLEDSLKMLQYFHSKEGNTIKIQNKYFIATVEFVMSNQADLSAQSADAFILINKPVKFPTQKQKEKLVFIAAQIEDEAKFGEWDQGEWILDYFVDVDEVGEIIGQAPFNKIERVDKQQKENLDIQTLIASIESNDVRDEVAKMLRLFEKMHFETNQEDEVEALGGVFKQLEDLQKFLASASEKDRSSAAAAVAIMLGKELGNE
ncbi:Conserved_hypothetical protein [Hexamita inflata]|uniref:Uncharacterized protein n=1 Tax=Hexamita inflata TaxID=28002 RepID=A0AA86NTX7_9EUKA|nr:Conserved hypothetical protein [Hexamita inflata]